MDQSNELHPCPLCGNVFHGDQAAFENHVNHHLDDPEEELEFTMERSVTPPPPPSPAPPSIVPRIRGEDDVGEFLYRDGGGDMGGQRLGDGGAGGGEFMIECEAEGCKRRMVWAEDMAEHMDRHLAEQLQGREAGREGGVEHGREMKRSIESRLESGYAGDAGVDLLMQGSPREKKRGMLDSVAAIVDENKDKNKKKVSGQTTMDCFVTQQPASHLLPSSASSSTPTTKIPDLSTSSPPPPPREFTFATDPLSSLTSGTSNLIEKTKLLLESSKAQGVTQRAYLADPSVVFCQGDQSDYGWGCGYRNLQMMLSYVIQQPAATTATADTTASVFEKDHDDDDLHTDSDNHNHTPVVLIPSITDLQQQLEFAWSIGYDPMGAQQLGHKVQGTKQWIGTTEAWSVLCSLGIRCSVLDFHTPTGPNGTHPAMLEAVYEYFKSPPWSPLQYPCGGSGSGGNDGGGEGREEDEGIVMTLKPPLYMQHQGHSRTIIGIEVLKGLEMESGSIMMNLLVFDPGRWLHKAIPQLRAESLSPIKLSPQGTVASTHSRGRGSRGRGRGRGRERGGKGRGRGGSDVGGEMGEHGEKGGEGPELWDAQYLLKAFRLDLLQARVSKPQYQLLGISGLYHEEASEGDHGRIGSVAISESHGGMRRREMNVLRMKTLRTGLSIGWDEVEAKQSQEVTSTRVP